MKSLKITINGEEKEVIFNDVYTRGVDKEYVKLLLDWADQSIDENGKPKLNVNASRVSDANDYLVKSMTNLTEAEINNMSAKDFDKVFKIIEETKNLGLEK